MHIVVNNYHQNDLSWLPKGEVTIYDKKDKNVGSNIYDYMDWIVKNYDNLPELVMFTKGNMLLRHIQPFEWEKIKDNKTLTPLMTQYHKTDGVINYYKDGLYWEVNSQWYKNEYPSKHFGVLANLLNIKDKKYLGFSPGACWIVPKKSILKNPVEFYKVLKDSVDHHSNPAEAHLIERCLYYIWATDTIDGI